MAEPMRDEELADALGRFRRKASTEETIAWVRFDELMRRDIEEEAERHDGGVEGR